jgi:hypothetical protein
MAQRLVINAEHYGLVFAPRLKKRIPSNLGGQFATLCGQCSSIYYYPEVNVVATWGQFAKLALTPSVKEGRIEEGITKIGPAIGYPPCVPLF